MDTQSKPPLLLVWLAERALSEPALSRTVLKLEANETRGLKDVHLLRVLPVCPRTGRPSGQREYVRRPLRTMLPAARATSPSSFPNTITAAVSPNPRLDATTATPCG